MKSKASSAFAARDQRRARMKGHFAAIALIVIGVIALGVNLDLFELDLVALIRKWWPLALIALGVGLFLTPDDRGRR
jgi:hypothetical protein